MLRALEIALALGEAALLADPPLAQKPVYPVQIEEGSLGTVFFWT
jgi:hypothetical protein